MSLKEGLDIGEQGGHISTLGVIDHTVKCETMHLPPFGRSCDKPHMAQPSEMSRIRAALERLMEKKGIKAKPLAQKAGLGETAVRDFLARESGDIRLSTLFKLTATLDASIEDLVSAGAAVQLSGRIGAGGAIIFEEVSGEVAPRPPGVGGELEALEVAGDSMLPRYSSGDIVYIQKFQRGVPDDCFGEYCAVRLTTGETYLKLLARGSRPGYVTLRSLNAADIEDVELEWAAPVLFVMPRASRRRLGM